MSALPPRQLRTAFRAGTRAAAPTGGLAPGFAQANIAILPAALAEDFEAFLHANPGPCPMLARGRPGDPSLTALGDDIDIRHDLPRYRLFRDGQVAAEPERIDDIWRDDLVTFAVGCSLSFEADLAASGVELRCHGAGVTCSAFDSALPLVGVGPFRGNLVVTMRAVRADQAERAARITRRHPEAHGCPVHIGDPAEIGVDPGQPIDGIGLTDIRPGEVAVYWACGVSMERALRNAAPDLAITHAPGHMLITDRPAAATTSVAQP